MHYRINLLSEKINLNNKDRETFKSSLNLNQISNNHYGTTL